MRFELSTYTKNQSLYWPNEKKNISYSGHRIPSGGVMISIQGGKIKKQD